MIESLYIHLSEPILTPLETERGILPIRGFHALAGLELVRSPYDPGNPFDFVSPEAWVRQGARFWTALAAGLRNEEGPWQTSFELRLARNDKAGEDEPPLKVSLWVKAFAPQDHVVDQAVDDLVEKMAILMPPPCETKAITTPTDFARLWGTGEPQWLAEVRRVVKANVKDEQARDVKLSDWRLTPEALRDVWELTGRLPGNVWLSIGLCPTIPFKSEERTIQELFWNETGQETGTWQLWQERLLDWSRQAFLVRVRIGGDPKSTGWLADALAAALIDPGDPNLDSANSAAGFQCSYDAFIATPDSIQDWQAARFNWNWGDFWLWGEDPSPAPLHRLRYLYSAREVALLAGVWG